MAMHPLFLSVVGGVLMSALEKEGGIGSLLGSKPGGNSTELPDPVPLPPEIVAELTEVKDETRVFRPAIAAKVRSLLSGRSVVRVEKHPMSELGAVWRVVPLRENAPNAEGIVSEAAWSIGALTLPMLAIGRDDIPMVIITGGRHIEGLAADGGHFAVISRPAPAPEVKAAPVKIEKPKSAEIVKNGATKKTETVIVVEAEPKEEGVH